MRIRTGLIAEIHEYGDNDSFIVGRILAKNRENYIFYHDISPAGNYQGWALISLRIVCKILYSTKYAKFFSKVLDESDCPLVITNPRDFLKYCFEKNRIVAISKFDWGSSITYLKIISFNEGHVVGQSMDQFGKFERILSIKFKDISWLLFDSSETNGLEKYLFYKENV